jgi:hypothetical protein
MTSYLGRQIGLQCMLVNELAGELISYAILIQQHLGEIVENRGRSSYYKFLALVVFL